MSKQADWWWDTVAPKLRRAMGLSALTPEEAQATMDTAEVIPMSEAEIERIAARATSSKPNPGG